MNMLEYSMINKEFKFVGKQEDKTVVIKKVRDMNKQLLFTIDYELLSNVTHTHYEFTSENAFLDHYYKYIVGNTIFNKFDYYNQKEVSFLNA